MAVKLIINGAAGRMGQLIAELAKADGGFAIVYGLETPDHQRQKPFPMGADTSQIFKTDVVIDFSTPAASLALLPHMVRWKKALVVGTTGLTKEQDVEYAQAAKVIPIVKSPNMSLGVNVLFKIAQQAAKILHAYDIHIEETHHIHKKDAPSGTALRAGALIEEVAGKKVTYESKREGEVVGDHRIRFSGPGETLELFHHAESRKTFAAGSLKAAKWLVKQKPGLYTMADVLGL